MSANPFIDAATEQEVHAALLAALESHTITALSERWYITRGCLSRMKHKRDAISARVAKALGFQRIVVYRRIND
jgi:sarcosine oxidase delta subunit